VATSRTGTTAYKRAREQLRRRRLPCHICGKPIDYDAPKGDPHAFEADHDTAVALGGTDDADNLRASHRSCNSTKRARAHAPILRRSRTLD